MFKMTLLEPRDSTGKIKLKTKQNLPQERIIVLRSYLKILHITPRSDHPKSNASSSVRSRTFILAFFAGDDFLWRLLKGLLAPTVGDENEEGD